MSIPRNDTREGKDTQKKRRQNQKEKRCSQTHRPQQGSDKPEINLRTTILKNRNDAFKRNDTKKRRQNQKEK